MARGVCVIGYTALSLTVLQGLSQPKVSGYRIFLICTPLRYSYVTFEMCAEIVGAPSHRVLDLG